MIDEKKIKQAAIECADEYYSLDFGKNREETNREIFVRGAHWAINEFLKDLWHPASEMPDKNRTCLVRVVYHSNHGMFQDEERIEQSSFHDFGWYDYNFKYIGTNYDIISWLYVDDLFSKKGGEQ